MENNETNNQGIPESFELKCDGCGMLLLLVQKAKHGKMQAKTGVGFAQFTTPEGLATNTAWARCSICQTETPYAIGWAETIGPVPLISGRGQGPKE